MKLFHATFMKTLLLVITMASTAMAGDRELWDLEYRVSELEQQAEAAKSEQRASHPIMLERAVTKEEADAFEKRHRKEWDNWPPKEVPREFEGALIKFRSSDESHYNHPNSPGPEIRKAIPVAE
jgi:hypothetical protein